MIEKIGEEGEGESLIAQERGRGEREDASAGHLVK